MPAITDRTVPGVTPRRLQPDAMGKAVPAPRRSGSIMSWSARHRRAQVLPARSAAGVNPLAPLVELLHQLAEVLSATTNADYIRCPLGAESGSLGGHVRHCLDHINAFLAGATCGSIDYDHRQRGTPIETRRVAALDAIVALESRIRSLDASVLNRPVRVTTMITADGAALRSHSSLGRELAFVLSHTIHHGALMAAMGKAMGNPVPEGLGLAPATRAHQAANGPARGGAPA